MIENIADSEYTITGPWAGCDFPAQGTGLNNLFVPKLNILHRQFHLR
jgi:hypothetical protein